MRSDELENQQHSGRSEISEIETLRRQVAQLQTQMAAQDADFQKMRQQLSLPNAPVANAGQPEMTSRRTMLRRVGSAAAGIAALSLAAGLNPAAALADEPAIDADGTGGATASYGGQFKGDLAQLRLVPAAAAGGRTTGTHAAGELYVDSDNNIYYYDGTGWTPLNTQVVYLASPLRLVGPPNRSYSGFPSITGNTTQYFPIAGFTIYNDIGPGNTISGTIPATAKGIIGSLSSINPAGNGYGTIFPANASQPQVASISYSSGVLTNAFSVKLGPIPSGPDAGKPGIAIYSLVTCSYAVDVVAYTY